MVPSPYDVDGDIMASDPDSFGHAFYRELSAFQPQEDEADPIAYRPQMLNAIYIGACCERCLEGKVSFFCCQII
jgi:hypothetical protein